MRGILPIINVKNLSKVKGFTRNKIIKNFWRPLWRSVCECLINKGLFRRIGVFNSCRPHQNRVIMQNECINARFYPTLGTMRLKTLKIKAFVITLEKDITID